MPQSFSQLHFHIVFSTKNRARLIDPVWEDDLYGFIGGILRKQRSVLLAAGGAADHLHLYFTLPRDRAVSDVVRDVKAGSSPWAADHAPGFSWQSGYGAFTVGYHQGPHVRRYLARQKEHHRQVTYQEEFRKLLVAHDIVFDEEHGWG